MGRGERLGVARGGHDIGESRQDPESAARPRNGPGPRRGGARRSDTDRARARDRADRTRRSPVSPSAHVCVRRLIEDDARSPEHSRERPRDAGPDARISTPSTSRGPGPGEIRAGVDGEERGARQFGPVEECGGLGHRPVEVVTTGHEHDGFGRSRRHLLPGHPDRRRPTAESTASPPAKLDHLGYPVASVEGRVGPLEGERPGPPPARHRRRHRFEPGPQTFDRRWRSPASRSRCRHAGRSRAPR